MSFIRVIRPRARRYGIWFAEAGLKVVGSLLKVAVIGTTALTGVLETWGQEVQARHATAALAAARNAKAADRWRAAFEAAPLGMAKVGLQGRLENVNSAFCALLGEPERVLLGRRLSALVYPDDLSILDGPGHPGKAKGMAKAEVRLVCAGGRLRWCELASSMVRDADNQAEYVLVSVVDITRHKRSQAALRDLATRDPLSGLANRRWFELQLAQHLRLCADDGPRGALLLFDLDNFKAVNDTFGHQAGDRLVIEVAVTLRRHLRDSDVVARLGGDEFAVVLRHGDRWAAEAVARKLVLAVRDEVSIGSAGPSEVASEPGAAGAPAAAGEDEEAGIGLGAGLGAGGLGAGALGAGGLGAGRLGAGEPGGHEVGGDPGWGVTVSVGVAPFELLAGAAGPGARDWWLKAADTAMYAVKRSGRNGYAVAGAGEGPHHARSRADRVPDLSAVRESSREGGVPVGSG